jgi:hypothetical protein
VKVGFENYRDVIRPGRFIVFDDNNAAEWPDVKQFVGVR